MTIENSTWKFLFKTIQEMLNWGTIRHTTFHSSRLAVGYGYLQYNSTYIQQYTTTIELHKCNMCTCSYSYALLDKYLRKSSCNAFVFLMEGGINFSKRCSHTSVGRSGSALNFTGFDCLLPEIR